MGRGVELTPIEIGKIAALREIGMSERNIAAQVGRSKTSIHHLIKRGSLTPSKPRSGRPTKITQRDRRRICRLAATGQYSLGEISREIPCRPCTSVVYDVIQSQDWLKYVKLNHKPPLTEAHKAARLTLARNCLHPDHKWSKVIFSDEKKFNLDGPDGWAKYWRDLRTEPEIFSKRRFGGGSLMVWAGFSSRGTTAIAFIDGTVNSLKYQEILKQYLLPSINAIVGQDWVFQQDNATPHTSKSTKAWFAEHGISVMFWSACSPDLNPIENLWGNLARLVYRNRAQYSTIAELRAVIVEAWAKITLDDCRYCKRRPNNKILTS